MEEQVTSLEIPYRLPDRPQRLRIQRHKVVLVRSVRGLWLSAVTVP